MLLLLAALLAQAADGVSLDTPKGWTRTEDPQKRFVQVWPPNVPQGRDCTLLIYPPVDVAVDSDALLDQVVRNMTAGKKVQGDIQKFESGIFKVAVVTQVTPQGWTEYLGIHATVWGRRGQAILYAASDFELFKRFSTEVLEVMSKATAPGAAQGPAAAPAAAPVADAGIAGMTIPFPAGWTRQNDPSGWVVVTPPQNLSFGNPRL